MTAGTDLDTFCYKVESFKEMARKFDVDLEACGVQTLDEVVAGQELLAAFREKHYPTSAWSLHLVFGSGDFAGDPLLTAVKRKPGGPHFDTEMHFYGEWLSAKSVSFRQACLDSAA